MESLNGIDVICFWLTREFPLLVFFFILNIIWLVRIFRQRHLKGKWLSFSVWLLTCFAWSFSLFAYGIAIAFLRLLFDMVVSRF